MKFNYIIKKEKMADQASFMKRIYKLSVWLYKRYKIKSKDCLFDYEMQNNNLVKIILVYGNNTN